jgi:hypothetical protein
MLIVIGVGVLIWGLWRTEGAEDDLSATGSPTGTPRVVSRLPTIPTPYELVLEPVDCPGTFASPEEAIASCIQDSGLSYIGDCNAPQLPRQPLERPCSTWEEGASSLRSYRIEDVGVDAFWRLIVERTQTGWQVVGNAGCGVQRLVQLRIDLIAHDADTSAVRSDDCLFPPDPLPRPALRIGNAQGTGDSQGILFVQGASYFPNRGVRLDITLQSLDSIDPAEGVPFPVALIAWDGTRIEHTEIGGFLIEPPFTAKSLPDVMYGWMVFPIDDFGEYTLDVVDGEDIALDLTPETYNRTLRALFESPKGR